MANDVENDMSFFMVVHEENKSHLAGIRHWKNLKIAFDRDYIWVKDIDYVQVNSLEVKSIPYKVVYYAGQGKLFLLHSQLPDRAIPALLWTPIERALPVKLPSYNHNYFGVREKISVNIIPSDLEREAIAMITTINTLRSYIETAPAVRLQVKWTILNNDKVFLLGTPLLPVDGQVFWQHHNFMIPAGHDFDLYVLCDKVNSILNPGNDSWVVWNANSTYSLIEKNDLRPLSLSSFRKSIQMLSLTLNC